MKTRSLLYFFLFAGMLILLMPFIAGQRPLYIKSGNEAFFPAFTGSDVIATATSTINLKLEDIRMRNDVLAVYPLITWSPGQSDLLNSYSGPFDVQYIYDQEGTITQLPFRYRHWLGTDGKGADVLAGLLHGFRYSMFIALMAIAIAGAAGIMLGLSAGYFGNTGLKLINHVYVPLIIAFAYCLFYISNNGMHAGSILLSLVIVYSLFHFLMKLIKLPVFHHVSTVPIDTFVMRLVEIMTSMPRLIFILALSAVVTASPVNLSLVLGLVLWPEIARFARAQVLQIKEQDYITAARSLGFTRFRILLHHVLRNGSGPLIAVLCFAFTNVILTEAGLAFIGIGLPSDAVTWGSLLSAGKNNFSAWWLVVFPGLAILSVVYFLNHYADRYQRFVRTPANTII